MYFNSDPVIRDYSERHLEELRRESAALRASRIAPWRHHLASALRAVAQRLEPLPLPTVAATPPAEPGGA